MWTRLFKFACVNGGKSQTTHTHMLNKVNVVAMEIWKKMHDACLQVVEKDLLIQEKEKLYMELKNILSRQPGPEVAEQLSIYQARSHNELRCCHLHPEQSTQLISTNSMHATAYAFCYCFS